MPKALLAKSYEVPEEIIKKAKIISAGKLNTYPATNPRQKHLKNKIYPLLESQRIKIEELILTHPNARTILLRGEKTETDVTLAGFADIAASKDAYIKDQNSENFSIYNKLQGLPHDVIRCLIQDSDGNIWFGTNGGGAAKFDGINFTNYTIKQGLRSNYIISIFQDKQKNIWFGTINDGLIKFDGKFFTHYSKSSGLPGNNITSILQDKEGKIWIGTGDGGLCNYNGKVFNCLEDNTNPLRNMVNCLFEDKWGNIWFGTLGGGAVKYDGKTYTIYNKVQGLKSDTVYSILEDAKGNIWFGTAGGGISCLVHQISDETIEQFLLKDKLNDKNSFILSYSQSECFGNHDIYSIIEDKNGNIWFGTNGNGISFFDGKRFTHFNETDGLSNNIIYRILEDNYGNIWLATDGGVNKYGGNIFRHYHKKDGLNNATIHSIYEDKCSNLWFGSEGGGISILKNSKKSPDNQTIKHLTDKEGLKKNNIYSISADQSGNLWFASYFSGISIFHENCNFSGEKYFTYLTIDDGLPSNNINVIFHDKAGNAWIGTNDAGISIFNGINFSNFAETEGIANNRISSFIQDKSGNIWIGTLGGGVSKYDGKTFTNYSISDGLAGNYVNCMIEDRKGNIWLGTNGGGISAFFENPLDKGKKYFLNLTEKEGLSNNAVLSMIQDKEGNIWFGTRFGISMLSPKNQELLIQHGIDSSFISGNMKNLEIRFFKNYTYDDGFHGIGCNRGAMYQDTNGTIWIGSNDRLTEFHPESDNKDTIAPNTQLLNLQLFNEDITWSEFEKNMDTSLNLANGVIIENISFDSTGSWYGLPENLSLSYKNNFLTFKFIGITQKQSKKVKYQYKLQGLDDIWSNWSLKNEVAYGNLPHGSYKFSLKAMNSEGYWSKELNFHFEIRPPWWRTKWFRYMAAFIIFSILFSFYKWRTGSLKKQKKLLEYRVKEKTKEVVLQKEELEAINEELSASNEELHNQREELESTLEQLQNAQFQIVQSEKMASLGLLAAGVAHEINNPLNFIQGGIEGLETYFNQKLKEHLKEVNPLINSIQVGVERAASIVTSLNHYSRQDNEMKTECYIHVIIDNCLIMLQNQTKNRIEIQKNYHAEPLIIIGNESKLHQAILNILSNAVQAIESKGKIHIFSKADKEKIIIEIEDTGCGIEKENLSKIFDPFFTTKEPGKGTGLGLSITYNIIKEHGGNIELRSKYGKGTKVVILFSLKK